MYTYIYRWTCVSILQHPRSYIVCKSLFSCPYYDISISEYRTCDTAFGKIKPRSVWLPHNFIYTYVVVGWRPWFDSVSEIVIGVKEFSPSRYDTCRVKLQSYMYTWCICNFREISSQRAPVPKQLQYKKWAWIWYLIPRNAINCSAWSIDQSCACGTTRFIFRCWNVMVVIIVTETASQDYSISWHKNDPV